MDRNASADALLRENALPEAARLANGPLAPEDLAARLSGREEFYRNVIESLGEGVLITDAEDRILYANRRVEEITGYTRAELIGANSIELLAPPETRDAMRQRLRDRLSGREEMYENEILRKDGGRRWVEVKAVPFRNAQCEIGGTIGTICCIERRKSLERENEYLLDEVRGEADFGAIAGQSPALKNVLERVAMVAAAQANVLILGESGTGKELVARAIHERSPRREKPLVRVNCASIPKDLFESEFFGHARGAFTGAIKDRAGRFEVADGGTLFLDEVGEIPLELQGKLLRVLQEGQFERVGEDRTRSVDVRVVAATNRDLLAEARSGRFRMDLYYRLSVFPIELPPLRDRDDDVLLLAERFLAVSARKAGVAPSRLTEAQKTQLRRYAWPGNVRELQNVIERAVILSRNGRLQLDLGAPSKKEEADAAPAASDGIQSLADLKAAEKQLIATALAGARGKVYGPDGAAALLGLPPTTLLSRMKRLGLKAMKP